MAKSITIHGLDDYVVNLIEQKAKADGKSLNKTIHALLEEALDVRPVVDTARRQEFEEFMGVWKKKDLAEFEKRTEWLRVIDEEDWR